MTSNPYSSSAKYTPRRLGGLDPASWELVGVEMAGEESFSQVFREVLRAWIWLYVVLTEAGRRETRLCVTR